jgi:hypothetical protein
MPPSFLISALFLALTEMLISAPTALFLVSRSADEIFCTIGLIPFSRRISILFSAIYGYFNYLKRLRLIDRMLIARIAYRLQVTSLDCVNLNKGPRPRSFLISDLLSAATG